MDEIMTPEEVASRLKVSQQTLRSWRMRNYGPKWFKLGDASTSLVRYRREDVDTYLRSVQPT